MEPRIVKARVYPDFYPKTYAAMAGGPESPEEGVREVDVEWWYVHDSTDGEPFPYPAGICYAMDDEGTLIEFVFTESDLESMLSLAKARTNT